jgi:PAS domain S-box-containing protein
VTVNDIKGTTVDVGRRVQYDAPPNVLLVDDQAARLLTYESILEGVGVNCVRALSGTEALDKLLRQPFALILLDVIMPGMDGFETARAIREHPRFASTPIIFITGVDVSQIEQLKGYEVGAIDYISLPLVPEILRSKVALLVELYKRRAELERLNGELEGARNALEVERNRAIASNQDLLREREERYRGVFEHPTELTVVFDAVRNAAGEIVDWRYRDANANAVAFLKRPREEVVDQLMSNVLGDLAPKLSAICTRVINDRTPHRYDSEVNGRHYSVCMFPIGAQTVVSSATDITVQAKAKRDIQRQFEADRAEKEWLAAVLNSMTEEVYFADTQQHYSYVNPAAMREFGGEMKTGVPVQELIAGFEVLRPDGSPRPSSEAPPLRALNGEVITEEEQIVRTPRTGELRHRQVSAAPVRVAGGTIIGSVSVVRDITDRKRFEAALAADLRDTGLLRDLAAHVVPEGDSKRLFDEILEAAITITSAAAGTIQLLDETKRELFLVATKGIRPALAARFDRVDATSGSSCGIALATGMRALVVFDVSAEEDPDGGLRAHRDSGLLAAQSTPLMSRSGRVLGMFSTHWKSRRALTEREMRFLDLLARQAADLIERMQGDEALHQRERELRESDRRKDEFIAVLAHELRNPLVPIRNGIQLLKGASIRPELIESVRPMMERQIGHMVRLIDDLLDVARIAAGKIELKRERVALSTIVAEAVDANRSAIDGEGLDLKVELPSADVMLTVDPVRIAQVVSNVLHNATKFTPRGGLISLRATRLVEEGRDTLILTIADTGTGIASDQLTKIFELFAQSRSRERGHSNLTGLGIGLAITRRLLQMHGGSIAAHSAGEGLGSEFTIRLPIDTQPVGELAAAASGTGTAKLAGMRVMIVDDNHDAADSMALLVEFAGAATHVAYSGNAALEAIEKFRPTVVLLDLGMPVMDGFEVCRQIRQKYRHEIAVVALSGWGQNSDKLQAQRAGFDSHLTKPADPASIEATLSRWASGKAILKH